MLTEFGKELRKIRIERSLLLKDMAASLHISSTFLSHVEHGLKKIPDDWMYKLKEIYKLNDDEYANLTDAYHGSLSSIKIDLKDLSEDSRKLAIKFSKNIDKLNSDDIQTIMEIINHEE